MKKLARSFSYAVSGLGYAYSTQPNFRIHSAFILLVVVAGLYFNISNLEWLFIVFVSGLVLITELINTAIEVLVDLVSPKYNEKAKVIKDLSAGAVVIACIVAVLTGIVIFLPKLLSDTVLVLRV